VLRSWCLAPVRHADHAGRALQIRTPLNATAGAIALLRESGTTPEQDELLDIATAGSAQVVMVVTDILSQAALSSGTFTLCDAPMHLLKDVVDPTWRMIQMGIQKKLSFILEVDDDVPECIMGDAARVSQILANLLHNASKFTPSGGIRLSVSTAPAPPRSTEDDAHPQEESTGAQLLVFAVQDTGIGLQSKDLDRIFAPFVQAESEFTTRTHGGTGLGLTICLRLARAMGGDIKAWSLVRLTRNRACQLCDRNLTPSFAARSPTGTRPGGNVHLHGPS
jgi:signal transduction histidine kinase